MANNDDADNNEMGASRSTISPWTGLVKAGDTLTAVRLQ
jgi:hypothetical protein